MLSLLVSYQSALVILGSSAEKVGKPQWSCADSRHSVLVAEKLVLPWLFPLRLVSVYEVRVCPFKTILAAFTVLGPVTEGTPGVTLPAAIRCGDGDSVHQMQSAMLILFTYI